MEKFNKIITLPIFKPLERLYSGNMYEPDSYEKIMNSEKTKERIKRGNLLLVFYSASSIVENCKLDRLLDEIPMEIFVKDPPNDINEFPEIMTQALKKRNDLIPKIDLSNMDNIVGNVVSWKIGSIDVNVWKESYYKFLEDLLLDESYKVAHSGLGFKHYIDEDGRKFYKYKIMYLTCFSLDQNLRFSHTGKLHNPE